RFAGKSDNERTPQSQIGNRAPHLLNAAQEDFGRAPALHALQRGSGGVLQGNIDVRTDFLAGRYRLQQTPSDLVRIRVQEAYPAELFNFRQLGQQQRQSVFQPEILAITSSVLPDKREFANSAGGQPLSLGNHRLEMPRAELSAKLRNDAEAARMIATFGNLQISRSLAGRKQARRVLIVKIVGQIGDRAIPIGAREAPTGLAGLSFRTRVWVRFRPRVRGGLRTRMRVNRTRRARHQDLERRLGLWRTARRRNTRSGNDLLQLTSANHRIYFGDVLLDLGAIALDQAPSHNQLLRPATSFVPRHLQNRVHRFLLSRIDRRAGIHDNDVGLIGPRGNLRPRPVQQAHHNLAIHQVLRTPQAYKTDLLAWRTGGLPSLGFGG